MLSVIGFWVSSSSNSSKHFIPVFLRKVSMFGWEAAFAQYSFWCFLVFVVGVGAFEEF